MGIGFQKFKRKLRAGAWLRAAICGLSLGLTAMAAQWLAAKLLAKEAETLLYAAGAGSIAVIAFGVMLAILLPTNRRIAKKLDVSLDLGEKVQTMLAFRNDSGDMAVLQREDTDRILRETPGKRVKGACTWLFALIPTVACLCMLGAILTPAKEPDAPPPPVDLTFSMTPWQEQSLKDLIEKVRASDMEESPKEGVVKELESLLIKLKNVRKESVMKETVISSIEAIHSRVSDHNTYDLIADALCGGVTSSVRDLGNAVNSLEALLVGDWMDKTGDAVLADKTTGATLAAAIRTAMQGSRADEADPIRQALLHLADDLAAVTDGTTEEEINTLLDQNELLLNAVLYVQAINEAVEDDTVYALLSIFGIKVSEVPEHVFNHPDDPRAEGDYKPEDDMDKIHAGGIGTGDMIFGSDDTVYDPETGTYVPYGEIIDRYYARITELFVDGRLTPEMEKAVSDYFAILFDGSDRKESEATN